jgi:DNA-binding response OmpR family regulator
VPRTRRSNSSWVPSRRALVELLTGSLADQGYDVVVAHHGGDGLMRAEVEKPDVVLLDVRMPGLNGVEVLQQMRTRWPGLAQHLGPRAATV